MENQKKGASGGESYAMVWGFGITVRMDFVGSC